MNKNIITVLLVALASLAHHLTGGMFETPFIFYYPATILSIAFGNGVMAIVLVVFVSNFISLELGHFHGTLFLVSRTIAFVIGSVTILCIARSRLRAISRLNEYIEIRDNFFAMSSHELRTPLAALKMRLQLRQRRSPADSPEQANIKGDLVFVDKMIRLISDMLDISRVNRGTYTIRAENDDLTSIVDEAISQIKPIIPHDRKFEYSTYDKKIIGDYDRVRIQQVISNLVDNSVKYGKGTISVHLYIGAHSAMIKIGDEGIIDQDVKNHIFEKFRRGNTGHGGLGVGLYLGKEIIDLHGGTLEMEHTTKTSFLIRLPFDGVKDRLPSLE